MLNELDLTQASYKENSFIQLIFERSVLAPFNEDSLSLSLVHDIKVKI